MNKAGSHQGGKRIRAKFEPEEDEILKQLVKQYGFDWIKISSFMPGRNVRQCRERWSHYLCSDTAKRPWTPEEDQILLNTVNQVGTKWSKVISHLTDRTDIQAKTRWLRLKNRKTIHEKKLLSPSEFIYSSLPISRETIDQSATVQPTIQLPLQQTQPHSNPDSHKTYLSPVILEHPVSPEEAGHMSFPFSDEISTNSVHHQSTYDDKSNISFSIDPKDPDNEISLLFFPESDFKTNNLNNFWSLDEYI